jgi:hypothetical protein
MDVGVSLPAAAAEAASIVDVVDRFDVADVRLVSSRGAPSLDTAKRVVDGSRIVRVVASVDPLEHDPVAIEACASEHARLDVEVCASWQSMRSGAPPEFRHAFVRDWIRAFRAGGRFQGRLFVSGGLVPTWEVALRETDGLNLEVSSGVAALAHHRVLTSSGLSCRGRIAPIVGGEALYEGWPDAFEPRVVYVDVRSMTGLRALLWRRGPRIHFEVLRFD